MNKKSSVVKLPLGNQPIAINFGEFKQFGCPYCGCLTAIGYGVTESKQSNQDIMLSDTSITGLLYCADGRCMKPFAVLIGPDPKSLIGFETDSKVVYPNLQKHPQYGTPGFGATKQVADGDIVTVKNKDFNLYGCPYCGFEKRVNVLGLEGRQLPICNYCGRLTVVLSDETEVSPSEALITTHPRQGVHAHGLYYKTGFNESVPFETYEAGRFENKANNCFICGSEDPNHNIYTLASDKQHMEKILFLFDEGKRASVKCADSTKKNTPIKIRIGACDKHKYRLDKLDKLAILSGGKINYIILTQAVVL